MASLNRNFLHAMRSGPTSSGTPPPVDIGRYPVSVPSYSWVAISNPQDPLPEGVVCGGRIETGQKCYIGKARVQDQVPCGFFTDEDRQLHVSYGCTEHVLDNFEVLIVPNQEVLLWQECRRGASPIGGLYIPVKATINSSQIHGRFETMIVGRTCSSLTEGRTAFDGETIQLSRFALTGQGICRPGKIHRSHNCLYVPYSGREYMFAKHEMLMLKKSPGQLKQICRYVILTSMGPYPSPQSVEKLPLPPKMKDFVKKTPSYVDDFAC